MMMTYLFACRSGAVYRKQKDWVFDKEYLEKGISAYHNGVEDRAVLQEIMQDAKQGEFEILLTYMSDRMADRKNTVSMSLNLTAWELRYGQSRMDS